MISYTNQIKIVMDAVEKLIEDEFNIPVMDEHTGNESIVIMPEEDFLIENLSSGMLRSYNLDIVYTMSSGGGFERVKDHLTNRAERIKTLLFNNSSYSPSGTYKFHNGRVDNITYTRSEDDPDLWLATLSYSTMVMEAI
tara:strand:+ start:531 stop:947 length:417 start_codon:yes stop_codon:yes gene_type:complete